MGRSTASARRGFAVPVGGGGLPAGRPPGQQEEEEEAQRAPKKTKRKKRCHDEGSLPHHQLRRRRGTSSHVRREGHLCWGYPRENPGRRPKDRAAFQILRQPASSDVRKPTISEGRK